MLALTADGGRGLVRALADGQLHSSVHPTRKQLVSKMFTSNIEVTKYLHPTLTECDANCAHIFWFRQLRAVAKTP